MAAKAPTPTSPRASQTSSFAASAGTMMARSAVRLFAGCLRPVRKHPHVRTSAAGLLRSNCWWSSCSSASLLHCHLRFFHRASLWLNTRHCAPCCLRALRFARSEAIANRTDVGVEFNLENRTFQLPGGKRRGTARRCCRRTHHHGRGDRRRQACLRALLC